MKKFIRWTALFILVFVLWDGMFFSYWRSTGAENQLSNSMIMSVAFVYPFLIFASIMSAVLFVRWYKNREAAAPTDSSTSPNDTAATPKADLQWLNVYQIGLQTAFGDTNTDHIEPISKYKGLTVDNAFNHPSRDKVYSRRIADLEPPEPDGVISEGAGRAQAITAKLLESLNATLTLISEQLQHSEQMDAVPTQAKQAVMHPAWKNEVYDSETASTDEPIKPRWTGLSLRIVIFYPKHFNAVDRTHLEAVMSHNINTLNIPQGRIETQYMPVHDADEILRLFSQFIASLAATTTPELILILGADSTLDQTLIDAQPDGYVPTEGGFSLLLGNDSTAKLISTDIPIIAQITSPFLAVREVPLAQMRRDVEAAAALKSFEDMRRAFPIEQDHPIPENGRLISDLGLRSEVHAKEFTKIFNALYLSLEEVAYTGIALENNNTLSVGIALTVAIQFLQNHMDLPYVPVLCSSGDMVRGVWVVQRV